MSVRKEIGVGVIGLGFMGRTHVAAYEAARREGYPCRLVAVCDRSPERRAGRLGSEGTRGLAREESLFDPRSISAYAEVEEILADPAVELLSICTYTDTHADLAIRALEAGRHALVEKPLARTSAEARRVRLASEAARGLCMPAMCMRFWPGWSWLREQVRTGALGAVRSATFTRVGSRPGWSGEFYADFERSGGALLDLHVHDADFVRWCFGPPEEVVSCGSLRHVTTIYRYASGPEHVVAEGGWSEAPGAPFRMRYRVEFERATAEFDLASRATLTLHNAAGTQEVPLPAGDGYDGQIRHLVERIAAGRRDLLATPAEAEAVLRLIEAEHKSLERGVPVRVRSA
ncbi:MAG: Gfo/Idh/MocA family oxidoreductase [Phycisphaerae bacterium]|jgi:predicted dehydrogenase